MTSSMYHWSLMTSSLRHPSVALALVEYTKKYSIDQCAHSASSVPFWDVDKPFVRGERFGEPFFRLAWSNNFMRTKKRFGEGYDAALLIFSCFGNNGFDAGIRFRNIIQYTKFYLYGVIYRGLIGLIWGVGKHVIINTNKPFLYIRERYTYFHRILSHSKSEFKIGIKHPSWLKLKLRMNTLKI